MARDDLPAEQVLRQLSRRRISEPPDRDDGDGQEGDCRPRRQQGPAHPEQGAHRAQPARPAHVRTLRAQGGADAALKAYRGSVVQRLVAECCAHRAVSRMFPGAVGTPIQVTLDTQAARGIQLVVEERVQQDPGLLTAHLSAPRPDAVPGPAAGGCGRGPGGT